MQENEESQWAWAVNLNRMVRMGVVQRMTDKQRPERREGLGPAEMGKGVPGRGNSQAKTLKQAWA